LGPHTTTALSPSACSSVRRMMVRHCGRPLSTEMVGCSASFWLLRELVEELMERGEARGALLVPVAAAAGLLVLGPQQQHCCWGAEGSSSWIVVLQQQVPSGPQLVAAGGEAEASEMESTSRVSTSRS